MEKFSNWRDKGTGISPFLPADPKPTSLRKYAVDPVLLAAKWPAFIAFYLLASIIPKPSLHFILKWLFSVSDIDILVEGVRKSNKLQIDASRPAKNDIVVSNLVSPLDVFVIFLVSSVSSLSSVAVVVPFQNDLYTFTAWSALSLFFLPLEKCVCEGTKLLQGDRSLTGKLVVLFAEGTPSNNKAVLPLQERCSLFLEASKTPVKVSVLRYYPSTIALPVPHMTKSRYVSRLLTLPGKAFVKIKIVAINDSLLKSCQTAFVENGLNRVELGPRDKQHFYEYFQKHSIDSR